MQKQTKGPSSQTMSLHREGTRHSSPAKLPRNAGRTRHRSQPVDRHPPHRVPVCEGGQALPRRRLPGNPVRPRPPGLLHRAGRCGARPRRGSRPGPVDQRRIGRRVGEDIVIGQGDELLDPPLPLYHPAPVALPGAGRAGEESPVVCREGGGGRGRVRDHRTFPTREGQSFRMIK